MREVLSTHVGESVTIEGTFWKYGTTYRHNNCDPRIVRFCLTNVYMVKEGTKLFVSDHMWFGRNYVVFESGIFNKGDIISLTGKVVEYKRGQELSDKFKSLAPQYFIDYSLARISKVEVLKKASTK